MAARGLKAPSGPVGRALDRLTPVVGQLLGDQPTYVDRFAVDSALLLLAADGAIERGHDWAKFMEAAQLAFDIAHRDREGG